LAREEATKAAQPALVKAVSETPLEQMLCLPITYPRRKN